MTAAPQPMSLADWREHNDGYLAGALEWLRLELAAVAPGSDDVDRQKVHEARDHMLEAELSRPPPAMVLLSEMLGLTRFEQEVVLLGAAMELDTRTGALCAAAHDDARRPFPTFALAMAMLGEPEWSALSPGGALRYWGLVEVDPASSEPLILRPLRLDERIVHFVKGLNVLDERIAGLVQAVDRPTAGLPPSQQAVVEAANASIDDDAVRVHQFVGPNRAARRSVALAVADGRDLALFELPVASLPGSVDEINDLARRWRREARLSPVALLLVSDDDALVPSQVAAVGRLTDGLDGPLFLSVADVCSALDERSAVHRIETPLPVEQRERWCDALGEPHAEDAARLAAEFDLDAIEIDRVAVLAGHGRPDGLARRARERSTALSRTHLDALAQRIVPAATWDDIVLSAEPTRLLHGIADQARHRGVVYDEWGWRERSERGLGITALFTGESGTGKTMAAEVLAHDLDMDLYRIDLAGVVSKYIGETEKNLRALFDAAEHGGVILFFDEADALFGKRSEVRDSHDRYANIEVDYLLQRMESYRGLAILATNMRSALDPAFTRRLRFIVPFVLPGAAERERIWARAFPPRVPTGELDPRRLSRLSLSGALINAIALNASFSAAAAGSEVTMDLVLDAARAELRKAERSTAEVESL